MEKERPDQRKYAFAGVFFVGLILLAVSANYCLNTEEQSERESRNRRIAAEVERFHR